jgi:hypothetical protein
MSLIRAAEKINLKKRVNMHTFRKSETSFIDELSDAQAKARHGWTQDSRMLAVYRHPDAKKGDRTLLELHGIVAPGGAIVKDDIKPKICYWCDPPYLNPAGQEWCLRCKRPLSRQAFLNNEEQQRKELRETIKQELRKVFFEEMKQDYLNKGQLSTSMSPVSLKSSSRSFKPKDVQNTQT